MSPEKNETSLFEKYYQTLKESLNDYQGELSEIIKHTPDMYKLFINLFQDPDVPPKSKHIINATILYFISPIDIVPEEYYGPMGYLDDLFLCTWSLKKLEQEIGLEILEKNWEGEEKLDTIIDKTYNKTKENIKGMEKDILMYVGLE